MKDKLIGPRCIQTPRRIRDAWSNPPQRRLQTRRNAFSLSQLVNIHLSPNRLEACPGVTDMEMTKSKLL